MPDPKSRRAAKGKGQRLSPVIATVAATFLGLIAPGSAMAQDSQLVLRSHVTIPEVLLIAIRPDSTSQNVGWILSYRNALSAPDTPASETGTRVVEVIGPDGQSVTARLVWHITRTRNDACLPLDGHACPDILRVLSVPEGFAAFPERAEVAEGGTVRLYIVPAGLS